MRFFAGAATLFLTCLLCSTARASGPSISDKELNITLTLPDGFEPIPGFQSPPNLDIRHAFRRMNPDGALAECVFIERLRGVIGREHLDEREYKRLGAYRLYREKWKSFELGVAVVMEQQDGATFITRNVQVPIKPRAIHVKIFGPESQDAELADLTRTLLGSLDGPSNWLTDEQRGERMVEGIGKLLFWIIVIGAVVYGLVGWRTSSFRRIAIERGLPMELAKQKIRPSWAWYLLPAYLFFACVVAGAMMVFIYQGDKALWRWLGLSCLGFLAASAITGIVMWRRVRTKRRILAAPPPLPVPPG